MEDDGRSLRSGLAGAGALGIVATVLAFYLPGQRAEGFDALTSFLFLVVPVAALVLPFALMALLLRTRTVVLVVGSLLLLSVAVTAYDLLVTRGDESGDSVLALVVLLVVDLVVVGVGATLDVTARAVRRSRRAQPER